MMAEAIKNGELKCLSVDATLKCSPQTLIKSNSQVVIARASDCHETRDSFMARSTPIGQHGTDGFIFTGGDPT